MWEPIIISRFDLLTLNNCNTTCFFPKHKPCCFRFLDHFLTVFSDACKQMCILIPYREQLSLPNLFCEGKTKKYKLGQCVSIWHFNNFRIVCALSFTVNHNEVVQHDAQWCFNQKALQQQQDLNFNMHTCISCISFQKAVVIIQKKTKIFSACF